jgi:hypothetical protein
MDIVSYGSAGHLLKLTHEAYERIARLQVPTRGLSFVACVDKQPIYSGAFWTPISSQSFSGVVVMKPLPNHDSDVIELALGYPNPSFYDGTDPRGNVEIMRALREAGRLDNRITTTNTMLPKSFKGYELYSWKQAKEWHFTLITGTNRNKTQDEIIAESNTTTADGWVQIHVTGVEAIESVIDRIPGGEWVSWLGDLHSTTATGSVIFELPEAAIVTAIKKFALDRGLNFNAP